MQAPASYPFPRCSRLQETFNMLAEHGVDELEQVAYDLSSVTTVRGPSEIDQAFFEHLEMTTVRLMHERDGPNPLNEVWTSIGHEREFLSAVWMLQANVHRVREVCAGVFALQYSCIPSESTGSFYAWPIENVVIEVDIMGIPQPSIRRQVSFTYNGEAALCGVVMAHCINYLRSVGIDIARAALFYRQINGAYQRVSWWDILPISHDKVRVVVCGDKKFLPSPRPGEDFAVTDYDIADFALVPTNKKIKVYLHFWRNMNHASKEQMAVSMAIGLVSLLAGGWVTLEHYKAKLVQKASIEWELDSAVLLREYPDNYRMGTAPTALQVHWTVPIPVGPYEESLTIYAACPTCAQIAGGRCMRYGEHLSTRSEPEDESD